MAHKIMTNSKNMTNGKNIDSAFALYLFHHVFLPSHLPQESDFAPEMEISMMQMTFDSLDEFGRHVDAGLADFIKGAEVTMGYMLRAHRPLHSTVSIDELELCSILLELSKSESIALYVKEQNAGMLITNAGDSYHFECFELSPTNAAVNSTIGRLQRSLPGTAVKVERDEALQAGFLETLAATLTKMGSQPAPGTLPMVRKAGEMHEETRDTVDPKIVTELLDSFLLAVGQPLEQVRIWKNTRDEVLWKDCLLPWRRSPMWLLIRLTLQLLLHRASQNVRPEVDLYKVFMAFLMGEVLQMSISADLDSDILYQMTAKLARRLEKLGSTAKTSALDIVRQRMCCTNQILMERWTSIQQQSSRDLTNDLSQLESLDFDQDTVLKLPQLDDFLRSIENRSKSSFRRKFDPKWSLCHYGPGRLPELDSSECYRENAQSHILLDLTAFELWIEINLRNWLGTQLTLASSSICSQLRELMKHYHQICSSLYQGNPELTSITILTILEIWIACDKAATDAHPMLRDYDPKIPISLFQSLLLKSRKDMQRLSEAEDYLIKRLQGCDPLRSNSDIYTAFGRGDCFSVRTFDQSHIHQSLLQKIETHATQERENKRREFASKRAEYENLMRQHRECSCNETKLLNHRTKQHYYEHVPKKCKKCLYKAQANAIKISIHEWPLPSKTNEKKSTVFELALPKTFGHWREASIFFLFDVLKAKYASERKPRSTYHLHTYPGLQSFWENNVYPQTVGLLSEDKPNAVTHRKKKPVGTSSESTILLNNGLHYAYFDKTKFHMMDSFEFPNTINDACTYQLPMAATQLQQFIFRPSKSPSGPSPNTVISSQHGCPDNMSLAEYKALASIPLGFRIVWQNILIQLFAPAVDFKKREVGLVILQCIYQAGPGGDSAWRSAHAIVDDDQFSRRMLQGLSASTHRCEKNWQSLAALATFVSLACRILTLTQSESIQSECLEYLHTARNIAFIWAKSLREKARQVFGDENKIRFQRKAMESFLLCADTFNVDEAFQNLILSSDENASIFLQCSVGIQEYSDSILPSSEKPVQSLHCRWQKTSFSCYRYLAHRIIMLGSKALDYAVKESWASYQSTKSWKAVSDKLDWLSIVTDFDQQVHFCLLTGELLVDGVPLDHLPGEYLNHPTYHRLFGQLSLDIVPTAVPGMEFSSKAAFAEHNVHLRLDRRAGSAEPDLLVHALQGKKEFDLIPSRYMRDNFPTSFVENYSHWYDHEDKCIEFCDGMTPWRRSKSNWKLRQHRRHGDTYWRLSNEDSNLIGLRSKSFKLISSILSPLEDCSWMHITIRKLGSSVSIQLPRLGLDFGLQPGSTSITSRQYRGMCVDSCQSVRTLIGLNDQLVLTAHGFRDPALSPSRKVLIAEGRVSHFATHSHVQVQIEKQCNRSFHAYDVDSQLGRLVSNGSYQSKLFLCYLHALTSFCIPDPLTGRTGTEEALEILRSAAVRSFDVLTQENIHILCDIARLTPGRGYYPAEERVMQTVDWTPDLSSLSQHGFFLEYVRELFRIANQSKFFHPQSYIETPRMDEIRQTSWDLLRRDNIRAATFRLSEFGAENHNTDMDAEYKSRDRSSTSNRSRSFAIARVVFSGQSILIEPLSAAINHSLWDYLARGPRIDAGRHGSQSIAAMVSYDAGILKDSAQFIAPNWLTLHSSLIPTVCKYKLMIWLVTLCYADDADIDVIQTLASFRTTPNLTTLPTPTAESGSFSLSDGADVALTELESCLWPEVKPYHRCAEIVSEELFEYHQSWAVITLAECLRNQWPCKSPTVPSDHGCFYDWKTYIELWGILPKLEKLFEKRHDNFRFQTYLQEVANRLPSALDPPQLAPSMMTTPKWHPLRERKFIDADNLLRSTPPVIPANNVPVLNFTVVGAPSNRQYRLPKLLQRLRDKARGEYEQRYVDDLNASLQAMQQGGGNTGQVIVSATPGREEIVGYLQACRQDVQCRYQAILEAIFIPGASRSSFLASMPSFFQMPRVTPLSILQRLNRDKFGSTPLAWKQYIADYGIALTNLQRAERMLSFWGDSVALANELRNPGHTNWDPLAHPDTLLLEIDSSIMVRGVQQDIADKMRNPPLGGNAVLQLNMGEGKSSVIVLMVASSSADGSRAVCIIVAKPQSKQMQQMLIAKLGGLSNRRVFYMPFTRDVRVGVDEATTIATLLQECKQSGGVLLVQPAHILSLQLMCIESEISGKSDISRLLLQTKDFLDKHARNVVDESDENFSVKFVLVYTMGIQQSIEHSPDRWVCVHHVLDMIRQMLPETGMDDSAEMEVSSWPQGGFPRLRILNEAARTRLFQSVARRLSREGTTGLPMAKHSIVTREAVFNYITKPTLTEVETHAIEQSELWTSPTKETLLLLRGLFAQGVLSFVFSQKRWRVDYGPDETRNPKTRLAVPYRAMDSPAARSEFSHPEVIIVLTSLSYYYEGLKNFDLLLAFQHLVGSVEADMDYEVWVADSNDLPLAFRQLSGVNLEDHQMCTEVLFPCFRSAKSVVDYFLAHIVFPKELKEFPHKLSASGWDIGDVRSHPTTGFSGTNDSRAFLPLTVSQLDDPGQQHTNALVLEYLLQDENSVALMPAREPTTQSDAEALLVMVTRLNPPARVILDVGAQVLELDNVGVASRWLQMTEGDENTQAVVFCDANDNICVIDRRHHVQLFHTSPFASQPDVCLVFLDEAHTRGTDLKLPGNYRAAVTLGANLTKDRLVQACMRMRKLGQGQSVVFCVPNEIQQKITSMSHVHDTAEIDVSDVLEWAISETFIDLRRGIWLWANQGRRHQRQRELWDQAHVDGITTFNAAQAEKFLEEEAQTLESRYRPSQPESKELTSSSHETHVDPITERLLSFGGLDSDSSTFREEQERELSPEIEQEREIQRPPPVSPRQHSIHQDIRHLISNGTYPLESKAWMPAFMSLGNTSASVHFNVENLPQRIMVTEDFAQTIIPKLPSSQTYVSDPFQRSVQWILTRASEEFGIDLALIISPHEAQELLPDIKRSKFVSLHLYAPCPNLGFAPLDTLDLYTVPRRQITRSLPRSSTTELNLFAGQLYFKSMEEYVSVCEFLGLAPGLEESDTPGSTALIDEQADLQDSAMCNSGLIQFMRILMTKIRRDCESIDKTHVGRILDSRSLGPEDFE